MTQTTTPPPPARLVWQARFMKAVNVPMRVILGLPFKTPLSSQLMLLYLTGRKTGKSYVQPVSFVEEGQTLLTPGGGRWKLNLRDGECVRARVGGRAVRLRPELIKDAAEVDRLLRLMASQNSRITNFAPVAGPDGQIDRERVDNAVRFGFTIVRWHFDCPPMS
jgi:F420H(2)-dependent quinone reductase